MPQWGDRSYHCSALFLLQRLYGPCSSPLFFVLQPELLYWKARVLVLFGPALQAQSQPDPVRAHLVEQDRPPPGESFSGAIRTPLGLDVPRVVSLFRIGSGQGWEHSMSQTSMSQTSTAILEHRTKA